MPPLDPHLSALAADTIVAPATPAGRSAVGVVRLSGRQAIEIARGLLRRQRLRPREAVLDHLVDAEGALVDQVLVTLFQAPSSYTGEDVVEISCHGSPPVLRHAVERAAELGARLAEPGEFTRRAWRNGRMDLVQAEAVRDLIDSATLYQARIAARQTTGALSKRLRAVKQSLLTLIARLEAGIDFAEDDIEVESSSAIAAALAPMRRQIGTLAEGFTVGKVVRSGLRLAIVGRPNVGKSSLFNRLLERERAIVNAAAGTTRDSISETASFNGIPVDLVDTAGIRATGDAIESEGVERSWQSLQDADCALVVVDLSQPHTDEDDELWRRASSDCPALLVGNKLDLPCRRSKSDELIAVSAKTGEGIADLRKRIRQRTLPGLDTLHEGSLVTNIRQEQLLREALQALERASAGVQAEVPHEMLLLDLYEALGPLDAITGATSVDDILDQIFSTFCIGK
ncbi:MAG: tRNA uridine-5-carboxymethylaminomethyl(34) synthesis GTPase MnmE [Bryobacterales bacterium]|nr:tRNA uridine-5-carboxymethylaminomethyl(34) synthesis GTPase MnmE [Bryobacterales bacterium]